jgi:Ca2+-binding RTX toxin-like protein
MVAFDRVDLDFILTQIRMAEAGQQPINAHLAFGLRQVAGTNNNLVPGQGQQGAADQHFLNMADPLFLAAQNLSTIGAPPGATSYTPGTPFVIDATPRTISNLISDQSNSNQAAVDQYNALNPAAPTTLQPKFLPGQTTVNPLWVESLSIPNVTPDGGISAPFNSWMTLFGQFFDHGLDLITKNPAEVVFIPLQPDDPLWSNAPGARNFMILSRATVTNGSTTNTITPFVDQSQTYTSHPSHQVFLREYIVGADGHLHTTGKMLSGANGGEPTWSDVKNNAKTMLGIDLTDFDVGNVPLVATDAYGNFIPAANGLPSVVMLDGSLVPGDLTVPVSLVGSVRSGHAFINDMAHGASPFSQAGTPLLPDADLLAGVGADATHYDNELLNAHFVAGDGRVNENIGLTAVHEVFHAEHNRLLTQTQATIQASLDAGDTSLAADWVLPNVDLLTLTPDDLAAGRTTHLITAAEWNGERLFQAAKFGTETQYQHLVFEEFARKISPNIHLFGNTNVHLDPAISSEFANAVYRFGHSMLNEDLNIYTLKADGTPQLDANGNPVNSPMGLIQAFTNPLGFVAAGGAAGIIAGAQAQVGNEIDEFVTGALRNNLLGLPLDLAALNIARGRDTGVPTFNLFRNQMYAETGDANLKAYESWSDFGYHLKHAASLVNFVAAYGKHGTITSATTLIAKRAAALALVEHAQVGNANFDQDAFDFIHSRGAYANNVSSADSIHDANGVAPTWSTGSVTGLDTVDMWIAGLAEKQNLNGEMLGTTFDFIFRTQMENLQDADRLYYLPRIEGIHWGSEIENNSFADLIQRNTGNHHLMASVFMTAEYTVEAGQYLAGVNGEGNVVYDANARFPTWTDDKGAVHSLVEVKNDGTLHFLGKDQYFGNTMVLGGTTGNDRLQAGNADDDTVWGDGGNDSIDGGGGSDQLFGGDGDDLVTDDSGDNVMHGDAGNDTVIAGKGNDLLFGGDGADTMYGAEGIDGLVAGAGNDVLYGGEGEDGLEGGQGDDWIEGGDGGGDALIGDGGAPTGQVPLYSRSSRASPATTSCSVAAALTISRAAWASIGPHSNATPTPSVST